MKEGAVIRRRIGAVEVDGSSQIAATFGRGDWWTFIFQVSAASPDSIQRRQIGRLGLWSISFLFSSFRRQNINFFSSCTFTQLRPSSPPSELNLRSGDGRRRKKRASGRLPWRPDALNSQGFVLAAEPNQVGSFCGAFLLKTKWSTCHRPTGKWRRHGDPSASTTCGRKITKS